MLYSTLLGIDNRIIRVQLLHQEMSPCFCNFTRSPLCQSSGIYSSFHILFRRWAREDTDTLIMNFRASGGMLSIPLTLSIFEMSYCCGDLYYCNIFDIDVQSWTRLYIWWGCCRGELSTSWKRSCHFPNLLSNFFLFFKSFTFTLYVHTYHIKFYVYKNRSIFPMWNGFFTMREREREVERNREW